jgi:hypothetical protein
MNREQELRNQIDSYNDSLFAILGFMNLYRFDDSTKRMRTDVLLFQGRRLSPQEDKTEQASQRNSEYVTPDIGILLGDATGVLGEVKASFPENRELWLGDFEQLMKYDRSFEGWPKTHTVKSHDIVLLLHYSRAVAVRKFYESKQEIKFVRRFCIIEFHRSSQAKEYFSLRIQSGTLSNRQVNGRLEEGIDIPMIVYLTQYSTCKIYDAEPPVPYLLDLIWTNVVTLKAAEDSRFASLRKNQKIEVEIAISEITERLYKQFSFFSLHGDEHERQPKSPRQAWVQRACDRLVVAGDAKWADGSRQQLTFKFVRKDDVLDYFIKLCAQDPPEEAQLQLFGKKQDG